MNFNEIEEEKSKLWQKKFENVVKLTEKVSLGALQECEAFFQLLFQEERPNFEFFPNFNEIKNYRYPYRAIFWDKEIWEKKKYSELLGFPVVDLKHKTTGKVIRVASLHLTGFDIEAKGDSSKGEKELEILFKGNFESEEKNFDGMLIMGDFNAPEDSKRCEFLKSRGFKLMPLPKNLEGDTHTNIYTGKKYRLDHIFFRNINIFPKEIFFENMKFTGDERISDHKPVSGILEFK